MTKGQGDLRDKVYLSSDKLGNRNAERGINTEDILANVDLEFPVSRSLRLHQ